LSKSDKLRPVLNVLGFIFGLASGCFAISNATISLLIVTKALGNSMEPHSDVSPQIIVSLCVMVGVLGVILIRGSLMVWKLRILGGAVNLASGIVLTGLSYALFTIGGNLLGGFYFVSLVEPVLMSTLSVLSGSLALAALF
jgi:hypothetical protein